MHMAQHDPSMTHAGPHAASRGSHMHGQQAGGAESAAAAAMPHASGGQGMVQDGRGAGMGGAGGMPQDKVPPRPPARPPCAGYTTGQQFS